MKIQQFVGRGFGVSIALMMDVTPDVNQYHSPS
jgi:hypothetical protein